MIDISIDRTLEAIRRCPGDIRVCEVWRAADALRDAGLDNVKAQAIRAGLAKVACDECKATYLADLA
jgi:hypothetical protein